ncbi:hypothetical protein GCM10011332_23470 [Terasakiella brassicae]|uniref:Uncharacterized protein n=1 Tax=Terasakiella brassicae TaxID=1634917 RepID=A0A917C398_9PROT|nr:hypothetical protein GCM10011332_23470 [Terasakiella brassicae]
MSETLGYAKLIGCDIEQVPQCIKTMVDYVEPKERGEKNS